MPYNITGKNRGSTHWSCNRKLTEKVPVILHNLKAYDSHLIIQEMGNFVITVNVKPNGLEKCLAFTINNDLVFIDSMQFMNSSPDALVKNQSNNDCKYLSQEFWSDLSKYEYMDSF